jgi:hypothetical protein
MRTEHVTKDLLVCLRTHTHTHIHTNLSYIASMRTEHVTRIFLYVYVHTHIHTYTHTKLSYIAPMRTKHASCISTYIHTYIHTQTLAVWPPCANSSSLGSLCLPDREGSLERSKICTLRSCEPEHRMCSLCGAHSTWGGQSLSEFAACDIVLCNCVCTRKCMYT